MSKLSDKILAAGVGNVMFMVSLRPLRRVMGFIAYTSSQDPEASVPCEIMQDRYDVADDYKIRVKSIVAGFGTREFYMSDLESCIREERVTMFIKCLLD